MIVLKIAALIFGVLGIVSFAVGGWFVGAFSQFGNSPYWKIANSGFWHIGLSFAALVVCLIGTTKTLKKPGPAAVWMFSAALIWIVLALRHVTAVSANPAHADKATVLSALLTTAVIAIPAIPAFLGALFAKIGSRS